MQQILWVSFDGWSTMDNGPEKDGECLGCQRWTNQHLVGSLFFLRALSRLQITLETYSLQSLYLWMNFAYLKNEPCWRIFFHSFVWNVKNEPYKSVAIIGISNYDVAFIRFPDSYCNSEGPFFYNRNSSEWDYMSNI